MMVPADLVIFSIKAGIRLGLEGRRAYIDHTKQRELVLPLPKVNLAVTKASAFQWFEGGGVEHVSDPDSPIGRLHHKFKNSDLTAAEEQQYISGYRQRRAIDLAHQTGEPVQLGNGERIDPDAYHALMTIRQWQQDDPDNPRTLRRVIGTVIEVAVDYFATGPGVMDPRSRHGRVISGFVEALDGIPFGDVLVQPDAFEQLVGQLLIAGLETISDQPEVIASDPHIQQLVRVATDALAGDIDQGLKQFEDNLSSQDRLRQWGELVFRSLLSSAGRHVVEHPDVLLGVHQQEHGALIQNVGTSLIDLAIENEELQLDRLFGRRGLDTLIDAALTTVTQHPRLIADTDNQGIKLIIADLAEAVKELDTVLSPDILPQLARLVLEMTGRHIDLVWPDMANEPGKHLLVTAAKTTLTVLSAKPPNQAKWKLRFGYAETMLVVESVIDELARHPQWLITASEGLDNDLQAVIGSTLKVLRRRADERLSPAVAAEVLAEAVKAVALRREFLKEVPEAGTLAAAVVQLVIDSLFSSQIDESSQWPILRDEAISAAVNTALLYFSRSAMDDQAMAMLKEVVDASVQVVTAGEQVDWNGLAEDLTAVLAM